MSNVTEQILTADPLSGLKMSELLPFLKIISRQQKLNLTRVSECKRARRILLMSITHN